METKLKNPKPGSKAAPPPQRGPGPLSLSARLYGPVLAVQGSASPRSAPWTAPGRAWGLAVYEGKGGLRAGSPPPGRSCTKERFCNESTTAEFSRTHAAASPLPPLYRPAGKGLTYVDTEALSDRGRRQRIWRRTKIPARTFRSGAWGIFL